MQLSHHHQPQGYKSSLKHHDSPLLTAEKEEKKIADVNFIFVFGIIKIYSKGLMTTIIKFKFDFTLFNEFNFYLSFGL